MPNQSPAFRATLAALGVDDATLSAGERNQLDDDGYVILHGVVPPERLERMRARLNELLAAEGEDAGNDYVQEQGTLRIGDLINKDPVYDIIFTHPRVLAAFAHVIDGDFRLAAPSARCTLPGSGFQWLHADWDRGDRTPPPTRYVANSIWPLDDFTAENGGTRVVPGSHRWTTVPQRQLPEGTHPLEVPLILPAGSVAVTNAYIWHGGGLNRTTRLRRALHSFHKHVEERRSSHKLYLSEETYDRLDEHVKALIDADSLPSAPYWGTVRSRRAVAMR